jgi:predicted NAD/FAD-dependent oxidoreductase
MEMIRELDKETTETYCLRALNSEIHEFLADPFIRINSLTATDQAPIGEFVWLLHAYFSPHIYHLDGGMDSFSKSLAQGLNVNLSSEVLKVEQHRRGVSLQCRGDSQARIYDACVLAVPPFFAKQLYQAESKQEQGYLDSVEPVPVVSLHLGLSYRPEIEDALVILPRLESKNICAIIFEHNKGAGRAPAGKAAITIQASREWTLQSEKMTDEVVRDALLAAVIPIVGDLQDKVETFFVSRWDYVCPVTFPGYFSRLQEFSKKQDRTKQKSNSAIFYAGDYFSGGMEGATISGARAARDIENYLKERL